LQLGVEIVASVFGVGFGVGGGGTFFLLRGENFLLDVVVRDIHGVVEE
jgi:hypothetical protein